MENKGGSSLALAARDRVYFASSFQRQRNSWRENIKDRRSANTVHLSWFSIYQLIFCSSGSQRLCIGNRASPVLSSLSLSLFIWLLTWTNKCTGKCTAWQRGKCKKGKNEQEVQLKHHTYAEWRFGDTEERAKKFTRPQCTMDSGTVTDWPTKLPASQG